MSVTVKLRASDAQLFKLAKYLLREGKTSRSDIKEFGEASRPRYTAKIDGADVQYNYTDIYYIVVGLQASVPSTTQPVAEASSIPNIPEVF